MKRFLLVATMLLCFFTVIGGHFYYNNKLEEKALAAKVELKNHKTSNNKVAKESEPNKSQEKPEVPFSNAPKEVGKLYKERMDKQQPLTFSLIGSTSTSLNEGTWAKLFKDKMIEKYGNQVSIDVTSFGTTTSLEVMNDPKYSTFLEKKPDVVIIEPFLLNDNGEVRIQDTVFIVNKMIGDIHDANKDSIVFLQPSNPIYKPNVYAEQVSGLEDFAKENDIPYIDYWSSWPSVDSEEVKNFYDTETYLPNKDGNQRWADYVFNIFK